MQRIPTDILTKFNTSTSEAEETLLHWLLENNVQELNCPMLLDIPQEKIPIIAKVIAKSQKVHTVNFAGNWLETRSPAMAKTLTGQYAKLIKVTSDEFSLTEQQLINNAFNLFISREVAFNTLARHAANVHLKSLLDNSTLKALPAYINEKRPMLFKCFVNSLLLHHGILTLDDISNDKMDEVVEKYKNANKKKRISTDELAAQEAKSFLKNFEPHARKRRRVELHHHDVINALPQSLPTLPGGSLP